MLPPKRDLVSHGTDADQRVGLASNGLDARPTLIRAFIYTSVILVLLLLWFALDVLLLIFAAILLAVFLRGLSDWLSERTSLSPGWSLALVVLALLILLVSSTWLLAPTVGRQARQLATQLPAAMTHVRERIQQYTLGQQLVEQAPSPGDILEEQGRLVERATGLFSTTLGTLANIIIILFVGLYLAVNPKLYTRGIERLIPIGRRRRAREVLFTLGYTLRKWLLGQLFSMTVVGVLMTVGYWIIGIPLALVLGILAGLLEFIPTFGPILSVLPALALSLLASPTQALYVVLLYTVVQMVESYLLTPLVQQRAVELPPAITIVALVVLGELLGFLGLLLATPIAAVALVLVKMLFVEDVLGDRSIDVKGEDEAQQDVAEVASEQRP